jgi:hypothetical protein
LLSLNAARFYSPAKDEQHLAAGLSPSGPNLCDWSGQNIFCHQLLLSPTFTRVAVALQTLLLMRKNLCRLVIGLGLTSRLLIPGLILAELAAAPGAAAAATSPANIDWPAYLGEKERSHYSPLAQINRSNVAQLKVAWTYDAGDKGEFQANNLIIAGVLYTASPTRKIALDEADDQVEVIRFREPTEVIGRRPGNVLGTIRVARIDAGVGQGFAQHDQVRFEARGVLNERRELAAGVQQHLRAARPIMHGSEADFARRFRRNECNVAPVLRNSVGRASSRAGSSVASALQANPRRKKVSFPH